MIKVTFSENETSIAVNDVIENVTDEDIEKLLDVLTATTSLKQAGYPYIGSFDIGTLQPPPPPPPPPPPLVEDVSFFSSDSVPSVVAEADTLAVSLGLKFASNKSGAVKGIKFYKSVQNIGPHVVTLYNSSGNVLAQKTLNVTSGPGWQTVLFDSAVQVAANAQYTAAYYAPLGSYSSTPAYFTSELVAGDLKAPINAGVYGYSSAPTLPTLSYNATNYWVDVVFQADSTATSDVQLGINADLGGMKPLSADDPWNQRIDTLAEHPQWQTIKASLISLAGSGWGTGDVRADFGSGTYNGSPIGIPYIVVPENQPLVPINNKAYGGDPGPYPIPPDAPIENYSYTDYADRHVVVVQRDVNKPNQIGAIYELFRAYPVGNPPTAWDANSYAKFGGQDNTMTSRVLGQGSTDAAGLPVFPGLVRYDEVMRAASIGRDADLGHALRFTVGEFESSWSLIRPATTVAGHNSGPIPFGARFRLLPSFQADASWPDWLLVIINTLRRYGMINCDNSAYWGITGAPDGRWDNNWLAHLRYIRKDHFVMVNTGPIVARQP